MVNITLDELNSLINDNKNHIIAIMQYHKFKFNIESITQQEVHLSDKFIRVLSDDVILHIYQDFEIRGTYDYIEDEISCTLKRIYNINKILDV